MVLSNRQFPNSDIEYRYTNQGADKKVVLAGHPDYGVVGMLNLERMNPRARASGLTSSLAYVHPDFRRRGIASAMYNIGSHEVGYKPLHDEARSPLGDKFARSVGGAIPADFPKPIMKAWDIPRDKIEINEKQAGNWAAGETVDPAVAKALTPVKPVRRRSNRAFEPNQLRFEGSENWGR